MQKKEINRIVKSYLPRNAAYDIEIISPDRINLYISEKYIPEIIGKKGKRISEIENKIGISIGVETLENKANEAFEFDIIHTNKRIILDFGKKNAKCNFDIMVGDEFLFTATTSKKGEIKIKNGTNLADRILEAIELNEKVTAVIKW